MIDLNNEVSDRKLDHINICLEENVEARDKSTGFEDIDLIHEASPEISLEEIDLNSSLLGKKLDAPISICPMTGGHEKGRKINIALAEAAQELNIAFGVGSQRAAIENPDLEETYQVREVAPDILLFGNLGVAQIIQDYNVEEARKAINMIQADALGLHFNSLQEAVQLEGDTNFEDAIEEVSKLTSKLEKPVYVKETGAGFNATIAKKFAKSGAEAIDISGVGGTSWAGVEALRNENRKKMGEIFWDWGIPTSVSTAEVSKSVDIPVISSGGIRTGLDAAKAIALGADVIGIGLPLFRESVKGKEEVVGWIKEFIQELKTAMFLTGCKNVDSLQKTPLSITGRTRERFISRGLDPDRYR